MNKIIVDPHNCAREEYQALKDYLTAQHWDWKAEFTFADPPKPYKEPQKSIRVEQDIDRGWIVETLEKYDTGPEYEVESEHDTEIQALTREEELIKAKDTNPTITVFGHELDDWTEGPEYAEAWTQVCLDHSANIPKSRLDESGQGTCGVAGCWNEAEFYVDFNKEDCIDV